jgi:hypothetical protein
MQPCSLGRAPTSDAAIWSPCAKNQSAHGWLTTFSRELVENLVSLTPSSGAATAFTLA